MVMAGGALQLSEVTRGSPSVLSSRGQCRSQCSRLLQERAPLSVPSMLTCCQFDSQSVCALSLPAGLFAANNIVSSVNNDMFLATTKTGRRRRKLYKMGASSPLLDSPLAVRKFNLSTDTMC